MSASVTARGEAQPPALELRGLRKSFGPVQAVRDVSLAIPAGSITGIIGENGAGKSTLMNLVYGLYSADSGTILVHGREAAITGPQDALRVGIGMVHQHFVLVDTFTVLENVVLGLEGSPLLSTGLATARRELRRIADEYGLTVDPDALVGDLPVGEQQRIEILKALYRRARILILDEPTAVLTPQETDRLFAILRELSSQGVTVVLITHKLREIMAVTDGVFVMRQGALAAERETRHTNADELAELMIAGSLPSAPEASGIRPGPVLLAAAGLGIEDSRTGLPLLDGVELELRSGEIVGVAGISGNGQGELLEALAGMKPFSRGRIRIGGREITPERPATPAEMRRLGVAHIPEHRHRHGMVGQFEAGENAILGYQGNASLGRPLLRPDAITRHAASLMGLFDVRPPNPHLQGGRFSGGNQQKLVIGREIAAEPRIILVGQPTRGVDIGAIAAIHRQLRALRDAGCAILVVSAELDEITALADRILVMLRGRIVGSVEGGSADPGMLGLMMSGARAGPEPREAVRMAPGAIA